MYVWNLWVFRHEIVANHRLPFLTSEILALSPSVPLALHNYTTFANVLAFPLIPLLGVVKTFNVLVLASGVMSGYAMYFYARMRTGDALAAWLGGLLFGFSPFMSARAAEHFSLTLAAPLPIFGWLMYRIYQQPTMGLACAAGATVAWAFLCDVYYAVYCLLWAGFMACYTMVSFETRPATVRRVWPRALVDLAIVCLAGLIVGILLRGGGQVDVLGIRVSFTRLYTPVLMLTLMIVVRAWMAVAVRPRLARALPSLSHAPTAAVGLLVCMAILSPVLSETASSFGQRNWISPQIWWRNSVPGVDLLAFFAPNPLHPWFGSLSFGWLSSLPGGFNENVASVPWVALVTIIGAVLWAGFRPIKGWVVFTGFFACLALGPFVAVAHQLTYVPTPWALLRYLPIIGAARTPTRLTVLVMLGVSMLLVMAVQHLRSRSRHPRLVVAGIGALLLFELLPAPRTLYSAEIPAVYRVVAADPRPDPRPLAAVRTSRRRQLARELLVELAVLSDVPREAPRGRLHLAAAEPEHRAVSTQHHPQGAAPAERRDAGRAGAVRTCAQRCGPQPAPPADRLRRRRRAPVVSRAHRVRPTCVQDDARHDRGRSGPLSHADGAAPRAGRGPEVRED